ncbi:MAG TPA: hypothetical protein VMC09_02990 [Anaerolineales bacterium]|nr:hypothetical protein [Anaerolineales bacterium]
MKKLIMPFILLGLTLLACGPTAAQIATQTAAASTATAAAWTPTPDFTAKVGVVGVDLYEGPGEIYPKAGFTLNDVQIVGQAYGCTWFKVAASDGTSGWLRADQITYSVQCTAVPEVEVPPTPMPTATETPIPTDTLTPTNTPRPIVYPTWTPGSSGAPGGSNPPATGCQVDSNIIIRNDGSVNATITLKGPTTFVFVIPPGTTTVRVCSGTYYYYITNGSCSSGYFTNKVSDGDQVYWPACQ